MAPRKKAESKPRITAEQRKDWRTLPLEHWNTLTAQVMVADLNRERYGVETYIPARGGFRFEQGVIKRALTQYGAPAVRELIETAFAEYRPTTQWPILTAGFIFTQKLPRIMPRILANGQRREREVNAPVNGGMTDEDIADFL
jgi:hypothetical protein